MGSLSDAVAVHACWAALVAYVEDVHQPQYNLTEDQWGAAERTFAALAERHLVDVGDRILLNALGTMLDHFDPPDLSDAEWKAAESLLARYARAVE